MKREFKVDANVGKPHVAYSERYARESNSEGKFGASPRQGQYGTWA